MIETARKANTTVTNPTSTSKIFFSHLLPCVSPSECLYHHGFTPILSVDSNPVGTAYAIWAGVGAVGTAIFGI
ncbi:MAG TPA: SMR family transporter, partial [Desulforhopalus sp.]|nr:SMR family transporter [Desulforhopalus sp.]